jgi:hypothetical protein
MGKGEPMAKITIPIQVNLPDDWIEQIIDRLRNDPVAEWAEIIRCRDCRWQKDQSGSTAWLPCRAIVTPSDFYCGRAERRTDEPNNKPD